MKAVKNYSSFYKYDLPFCICHQSAFFESTFIKANHYDLSYQVCADANLLNKIFLQGYDFRYVPYPNSVYEASEGMSSVM